MNHVELNRAMVIMAHPDEVEYFVGGTVALWTDASIEVTLVILTDGGKGSDDPAMTVERLVELRQAEQRAAMEVLGAKHVVFVGEPDCELMPTLELRLRIVAELRRYRPDIVIAPDPSRYYFNQRFDNHPDLRAAGEAAWTAVFPPARSRLYHPELLDQGLQPHAVRELWLTSTSAPNHWMDISSVFQRKYEALCCHTSQVRDPQAAEQQLRASNTVQAVDGNVRLQEAFHVMVLE